MTFPANRSNAALAEEQAQFMTKVYLWMTFGLATTAYTSYMAMHSPMLISMIQGNHMVFYGFLIAELILVVAISALINKISAFMATTLFFVYSLLNGLTFSVIFMAFTSQSVVSAFGVTAGMFAGLSAFGFLTRKDLSAMGAFMISALFGLILGMVVNMFLHNSLVDLVLTLAGVVIFSGLIAYDTQKIKGFCTAGSGNTEDRQKNAIYGALILYLDFINLFIRMLEFTGRRR